MGQPGTDEKSLKRRLRFEEMASDISAQIISSPLDQVETEIMHALEQIRIFFQVDRCGLIEVSSDGKWIKISHATYAEGISHASQDVNILEFFPWMCEKVVFQGQPLVLETLDDLPPEALMDRQGLSFNEVASGLYIPLVVNGRTAYVIVLNAVRTQRSWPQEYIPRLRLLGEVLVNALVRKKDRMELDEQLTFEMLLSDISSRFISLPVDRIDTEIEDAQRRVCECLGLHISVLWQWPDELPRRYIMTHYYRPLEGPPPPEPMYAHEYFPWCQEQIEAGRIIVVSSMDDLPPEAARDKEVWQHFGIRNAVTIPLSPGGCRPIGALTFNDMLTERTWQEPLIKRLQLIAQIFTNALVRKQNEMALRESEARLSLTTETVGAGLWIMDVNTHKVWVSPKNRELFHFAPDEELSYESFFRVIHPEDRDRVHQEVQLALTSGENLNCDYRIVLPDGNTRWIVSRGQRYLGPSGEPHRMLGLSLDMTERKKTELQLSESQTWLDALINSTSDFIWTVDAENFGILTFNRSLYEYYLQGRGIQLKGGERLEDLFPPGEFVERWRTFFTRAREEGSFTTEYKVYTGARTLRLNLNTLKRGDEVYGISIFGQDITEIKLLEEQLRQSLVEVQQLRDRLQMENVYLREEVKLISKHTEIVGDSTPIREVLAKAEQVSSTDSTVLILGETGTGKELLARAIHDMSKRKDRALVMVNCASLPPTLIESELFGREKGAYTGSLTKMTGRFELADGSTLFLDEIGELPLELQGKLLRVLEHGEFERLGSSRTIKINVRLIAATNRDLSREVNEGRFRKDLYYRLNVFPLTVPSLRDRKEDIPQLVWSFVRQFEKSLGKHIDSIPKKNMEALTSYPWPGNIRELRNVIEHAMIMNKGRSLDIEPPVCERQEASAPSTLEDMERRHIIEVLDRAGWRISGMNGAAEILGMKRTTLQSKMKALGIHR